ncbi:hypothetical protein Fuma_02466 [Fuerstiella marisgermanici]|uniref:Uncharacterized protein n=1 Tax=Fuerstiella marisgermanici TaxID=1891926 RepID=A0A1P8WFM0_9PLAN|nr:hypothetical protein Fuma_02466 [Fuerstiella marisgermanici]
MPDDTRVASGISPFFVPTRRSQALHCPKHTTIEPISYRLLCVQEFATLGPDGPAKSLRVQLGQLAEKI